MLEQSSDLCCVTNTGQSNSCFCLGGAKVGLFISNTWELTLQQEHCCCLHGHDENLAIKTNTKELRLECEVSAASPFLTSEQSYAIPLSHRWLSGTRYYCYLGLYPILHVFYFGGCCCACVLPLRPYGVIFLEGAENLHQTSNHLHCCSCCWSPASLAEVFVIVFGPLWKWCSASMLDETTT